MYTSARASAPRLADLRAIVPSALVASSYPESIILSRITSVNHEEKEEKGGMREEEGGEGGKERTKGRREGER